MQYLRRLKYQSIAILFNTIESTPDTNITALGYNSSE